MSSIFTDHEQVYNLLRDKLRTTYGYEVFLLPFRLIGGVRLSSSLWSATHSPFPVSILSSYDTIYKKKLPCHFCYSPVIKSIQPRNSSLIKTKYIAMMIKLLIIIMFKLNLSFIHLLPVISTSNTKAKLNILQELITPA